MTTKLPRVQVTLNETMLDELTQLTIQSNKSLSSTIKELVLEALELREDLVLTQLAESLDQPNSKLISHEQAWNLSN